MRGPRAAPAGEARPVMRCPAPTRCDGSALNLAPGQAALSSANCCARRLGGCNNHLKGEIKAPLNEVLCPRPHLMLWAFSNHAGEGALNVCPAAGAAPVRAGRAGDMEKGLFSVEWLAQSSRGGGGREMPDSAREREAAGSRSPGHAAGPGSGGRARTKFSAAQLQELERSFRQQRYIGAGEKRRLAAVLNLSQSQIKTWFQNRRMKFKRQTQDARIEALFSGLFLPYHCYPDTATSSYPRGVDVNVSAASLHPAMPNPALLLPSVPAQSLQPVLPSPALLLPPGLSCYSSVLPAVTLTTNIKD